MHKNMDSTDKLKLLSDASQYDLSCACGTQGRDHRQRGADGAWLYPVSLPRGGVSIMLKTLMSNVCTNDCGYCPYRNDVDVPRCTIGADEMAQLFMEYVRVKKIAGAFLSSGVIGSADNTMRLLNDTARIIRKKYQYRGYIHLKVIPGASDAAIEESISLASAVSLNIETPGKQYFDQLSSRKEYNNDIIRPLKKISELTARGTRYSKVKTTTQFIVGAAGERDSDIVKYTAGLYNKLKLDRVYFSAYQRGLGRSTIPGEKNVQSRKDEGFIREHRLYQTDFLFRKYGFEESDICFDNNGQLSLDTDPKKLWADNHPEFFPVYVNRADKFQLLRVPGIGPLSVKKILECRKQGVRFSKDDLPLRGKLLELAKTYLAF